MKVFISADIEGVASTTEWSECEKGRSEYNACALQMTKEVIACCEGAIEAGATEIIVKDAHDKANNIDITMMPSCVYVHRKWSGHPFSMVDTLNGSYDCLMFIGYHNGASMAGNPLSHTMNYRNIFSIRINEELATEFTIHSYAGMLEKVPSIFLSGDKALCEYSKNANPKHKALTTVPTKEGIGSATINYSPQRVLSEIKSNAKNAFDCDLKNALPNMPKNFKVEITYKEHTKAYSASFYPNMKLVNDNTLIFENSDYFEVLRALKFVL